MAPRVPFVVVVDCDGTLTQKNEALCKVVDEHCLSKEIKAEIIALRGHYLEKALLGTLTKHEEADWLEHSFALYMQYKLSMTMVEEALQKVIARRGVRECFSMLDEYGIPVAVVSYGAAQFVRTMLAQNNLLHLVDRIYSADLTMDSAGNIIGYDRQSFVLPSNKGMWSRCFANRWGVRYEDMLAVGDSRGDKLLGSRKKNRLAIAKNEEEAAHLAPFMGKIVTGEDFAPVTDWLREKMNLR